MDIVIFRSRNYIQGYVASLIKAVETRTVTLYKSISSRVYSFISCYSSELLEKRIIIIVMWLIYKLQVYPTSNILGISYWRFPCLQQNLTA